MPSLLCTFRLVFSGSNVLIGESRVFPRQPRDSVFFGQGCWLVDVLVFPRQPYAIPSFSVRVESADWWISCFSASTDAIPFSLSGSSADCLISRFRIPGLIQYH